MAKRSLIVLSAVAVALVVAIGTRGYHACGQGELCLPGTEPPSPPPGPPRAYLPLVVRSGGQPPEPGPCATETEPNDTHTDAQALLAGCVDGNTSWDGDPDWYRLNVCSGPLDLTLVLSGPEGADLDLYLYDDPPGWPLYASEEPGSSEVITATNIVTGTYYALVQPAWGSGDYTLSIEVRR